ncbi:MAG: PQQ-binding-like beta-propeller repeat protein [Carboxylicivirga sp.]|nr:PQQ-binding-like beta-propeller repeat protein [Carboxylicivirga sp.]
MVTPMMGGDYRPGFNREDIGGWLKNLLNVYDKEQAKIFFNHDLLTNGDEFAFRINDNEKINFNDYNLKAWLYGHLHVNMAKKHGDSEIMSYGTSTLVKGGIDHSPSGFRVVHVDENGETGSEFRWTYLDREIEIASPNKNKVKINENGEVEISVNTYHSGAEIDSVKFAVWGKEGFNWNSSMEFERWQHMTKSSDWNWRSKFTPEEEGKHELVVDAYLKSGEILHNKTIFFAGNQDNLKVEGEWWNMGGNKEHNAVVEFNHELPYILKWTANIGSNIFMSSPVVYGNYVMTSGFDDGNADNCFIVCFDASSGKEVWRIKTINGVKNQMVIAKGLLIATDMQGLTYAIDIKSGNLNWKKDLGHNRQPAFVSGIVTDGEAVFTGYGHSLSALDAETGDLIWNSKSWHGGSGATPTMTLTKDVLVVSSHWDAIYGHNPDNGELLWTVRNGSLRFRDGVLAAKDGALWVAERFNSEEGKFYQLNSLSGEIENSFPTNMQNTGTSAPIILDSMFIVAGSHPGIVAFDRQTKEEIWQFEVGPAMLYTPSYFADRQQSIESTPVLIGDKLVFGAMDGCIYVLDVNTGRLLWKTRLGAPILTSVAVIENGFFICDFAGNIYYFKCD